MSMYCTVFVFSLVGDAVLMGGNFVLSLSDAIASQRYHWPYITLGLWNDSTRFACSGTAVSALIVSLISSVIFMWSMI